MSEKDTTAKQLEALPAPTPFAPDGYVYPARGFLQRNGDLRRSGWIERCRGSSVSAERYGESRGSVSRSVLFLMVVLVLYGTMVATMVKVLQEYERGVIFRLGRVLSRPKGPGLILMLPFGIDRMRKVVLQTVTMNVPPQDVITRDNFRIRVAMVVNSRVVDPVRAVVQVHNYLFATSQAARTNLRALLGKYDLDTLVAEPERINQEMHDVLARATRNWGVEIDAAEINDVDLPDGEQANLAAIPRRDAEARAHTEEGQERPRQVGEPKVFLCYRREDTQGFARGIYESLAAKYGDKHVFRDIDSTPAGVRYSTWIQSRIGQCSVMVVLIGHTWASAKDQVGRRRLELPTDWVRREIEEGLRLKVPIIPVCIQGARMPSEDELPSSIADLAGFQSTDVTDSRWDFDIERLLRAIDDLISSNDDQ
jgi:hypothetical protein